MGFPGTVTRAYSIAFPDSDFSEGQDERKFNDVT